MKRSRINPISKKRRAAMVIYAEKRKKFLEDHPYCAVYPALASCEIHHKAGRVGKNYLDETTWAAVSWKGHKWIHNHPADAMDHGLIIRRS